MMKNAKFWLAMAVAFDAIGFLVVSLVYCLMGRVSLVMDVTCNAPMM